MRVFRTLLLVTFVIVTGGSAAFLASKASSGAGENQAKKEDSEQPAKLRRAGADGIIVPEAIAKNIGMKTETAMLCTKPVALPPMQGRLALDTNLLDRVRTRVAGEVVSLGPITVAGESRTIRKYDTVRKGDLLAVVWSKDLGEKKSELVDSISKLNTDEETLKKLKHAYEENSVPERAVRDAERNVESDRIAVERAERTLRTWRLNDDEIAAVKSEADRKTKPDLATWARVELRSPRDGMILEMNVSASDIVDTATDLFKVGNLSRLVVWVDVYEEDLPLLQSLPKPVNWKVQLLSRPEVSFPGKLETVGAVIDPNQHTALVSGHVENPKGDLKAGQSVTVMVAAPAPAEELELPADAVVENGKEKESFVFVAGSNGELTRTPVKVARRGRDVVCIRVGGGVKPGDRVVTTGALLLRDAMDDLPPAPNENAAAK